MEVISEHAIDFQGVPPDYDGDAVAYIADRILALLSAPEPAETAPREPDAMCHASHWRRDLDEWCGQLTVRPYDPEKCSGEGPPWPVWIGAAPPLGSPAPADPRPMECSVCGAGYIGSRAGEECGVEGCDGRLYFVVAETGGGEPRSVAWVWAGPEFSELKLCPTCGEATLEGFVECSDCGHAPSDDETWRKVRAAYYAVPTAAEPEREAPVSGIRVLQDAAYQLGAHPPATVLAAIDRVDQWLRSPEAEGGTK
jgi:hypothetical protein